jgi:hypothetical protein
VAFESTGTNLGAGEPGGAGAVWVRDLQSGTVTLASRANGAGGALLGGSQRPSISGDGRRVAFVQNSATVHVRDLVDGTTETVGPGAAAEITDRGGHVTFWSDAGLAPGATGGTRNVFRRELAPPGAPISPPATPGSPPRNIEPPSIVQADRLRDPRLYVCDEGTWQGLAAPPGFTYRWIRYSNLVLGRPRVVATTRAYRLPPAPPGANMRCEVTATNGAGTGVASSRRTFLSGSRALTPFESGPRRVYGDVRIRGIDLYQTVQPSPGGLLDPAGTVIGGLALPSALANVQGGGTPFTGTQTAPYAGVRVDATKPATAIVYVDMNVTPTTQPNQALEVTLSARVGGRALTQTRTQTITSPQTSSTRFVTAAERDDPRFGVQFPVPAAWLASATASGERLDLQAQVQLPLQARLTGVDQCAAPTCGDNDTFRLTGIPVFRLPDIVVASLEMRGRSVPNGAPPPPNSLAQASQVLARAVQLFPGGERISLPPFAGSIDIGFEQNVSLADHECLEDLGGFRSTRSCRQYYIGQRMQRWELDNRTAGIYRDYQMLVGIHDYLNNDGSREPGWQFGVQVLGLGVPPYLTVNSGTAGRPLTAAAHELGHALGAPHAGQACPNTGVGQAQQGEFWASDDMGRLQGVMWDRVSAPTLLGQTDPAVDTAAASLFDLMSYCGAENNAWLSAWNWSRVFSTLRAYDALLRRSNEMALGARELQAGVAIAFGAADPRGGRIGSVLMPDGEDSAPPAAVPSSPLRLRALDAGGRVLADVGVALSASSEGPPDAGTFAGAVPAAAATIELVRNGAVLDRLVRSRPPRVALVSPRAGARARSGRPLTVRWRAGDPDSPAIEATVDYSPDAGRSWRSVQQGPSTGLARIPARYLAGGRARVRVSVSDGFNEAAATSGVIRAQGVAPVVRIERPARREPVRARERTLLVGSALDDRSDALRGRSLTWFAGRRRLGTGERLTVVLPAGRVALRLVARDGRRLTGEARATLRVAPARLELDALVAPDRVRPAARSVAVRVRASAPARFRVAGRSFALGTTARRIVVPLPRRPRIGVLTIPYRLTAAAPGVRGTVRGTFQVPRF